MHSITLLGSESSEQQNVFTVNRPFNPRRSSMLKEFQKAARWLGRSQDPFINFAFLFDVGIEGEGLDPGVESAHSEMYVSFFYGHSRFNMCMHTFRSGYEFYLFLYALLKGCIPGFSQHMAPFKRHGDKLNPLTQEVSALP